MAKRGTGGKSPDEKDVLRDILDEEEFLIDDENISAGQMDSRKKSASTAADSDKDAVTAKKAAKKKKVRSKRRKKSREDVLKSLLREQNKNTDPEDGYIIKAPWKKTETRIDEERKISRLLTGSPEDDHPVQNKKRSRKPAHVEDPLRSAGGPDSSHKTELEKAFIDYPAVHRRRVFKMLMLAVVLLVIIILVADKYSILGIRNGMESITSPVSDKAARHVQDTRYVNRTTAQNISYENLGRSNDSKVVSITGFLRFDLVRVNDNGLYNNVYTIVDDFGDQIRLTGLSSSQKLLFHKGVMSRSLFRVTGVYSYSGRNGEIKVQDVSEAERPTRVVQVAALLPSES